MQIVKPPLLTVIYQ